MNCGSVTATVAISTGQALFAVAPALLFCWYPLFGAVYCHRKGEVGSIQSAGIVKREESPTRFLFGIIWLALMGSAFLTLGVYRFVDAIQR